MKNMRKFNILVHSVLLATTPSLFAHPQVPVITVQVHEAPHNPLHTDALPYDQILQLMNDLESGELENRCSEAELERINEFLANLALQGILPGEEEQIYAVANDVRDLLQDTSSFEYALAFGGSGVITPAIFYQQGEVVLCKGWLKKKWEQTKKFVKKHRKEIIIGAVVVVGAAVVVGAIALAGSAAATGAAAAAASGDNSSSKKADKTPQPSAEPAPDPFLMMATEDALKDQIASFKDNLVQEQFFASSFAAPPLEETGRMLGSLFAHDSFKQFSSQPTFAAEFHTTGHQEIDRKFGTDYASLYTHPISSTDFNELTYRLRGESALASGHLHQAVYDFNKAIEHNSTNPLHYLERGVAHFGLGEYEQSIEDYQMFAANAQRTYPLSIPEFSLGFAKGLPKGIYESGSAFLLFLHDAILHPIQTSAQMYEALSVLSSLAATMDWTALSEALAPEIHQLVRNWHTIPSNERGEITGYLFGKYGADIFIPGAVAKIVSRGLKGAHELAAIQRSLKATEQTLLLETVAGMESGEKVAEMLHTTQNTLTLGEELGFSTREMVQLKQAGTLETTITKTAEHISQDASMRISLEKSRQLREALKPFQGKYMPESEIRQLLQQNGVTTFSRPAGIPENYRVKLADKGAGMKYVHPTDEGTYIRVMPGTPHSPNPCQQRPYVNHRINGQSVDKSGKIVDHDSPAAHIPLEEFVYKNSTGS